MGCVYVWTNKVNGKQYVGLSVRPEGRMKDHLLAIRSGSTLAFHNAVRKYGEDAFTYEEVFWSDDRQELAAHEIAEIAKRATFKDSSKGYNLTPGGDGVTDMTPESRAKMMANQKVALARPEVKAKKSASAKAANARPEVKQKIVAGLVAAHARPEVKAKHTAATRAAQARPEVKEKHSVAMVAARSDPEVNAKWVANVTASLARPEVKASMSAKAKVHRRALFPNIFGDGEVFLSTSDAATHLNLTSTTIDARVRSKTPRFRWWFTIPNHNDPACDAVEYTWAVKQMATEAPDHPNLPDWARAA